MIYITGDTYAEFSKVVNFFVIGSKLKKRKYIEFRIEQI
jgi:hypothetical protein